MHPRANKRKRYISLQLTTTNILRLHLRPSITQAHLTRLLDLDLESDLLPTFTIFFSRSPNLRDSDITGLDRRSESCSIFFDTRRISASDQLDEGMSACVPRVEPMNDDTTEA